jgi:hypothetical protein
MKKLLLFAALVSLLLPMSAQAAVVPTQDIVLGPYNVSTVSNPLQPINILPNSSMELQVLNPTPGPLTFSAPDLGLSVVVPANSERRISLNPAMTANLTPGQQVAYYILDPSGNQLASSYFVNQEVAYNFEQTQTTVGQTTTETTPAPARTQPQRSSTVRGFW